MKGVPEISEKFQIYNANTPAYIKRCAEHEFANFRSL